MNKNQQKPATRSYRKTEQGISGDCCECGLMFSGAGNEKIKHRARKHTQDTGHSVRLAYTVQWFVVALDTE